jgi:hypothetical protein
MIQLLSLFWKILTKSFTEVCIVANLEQKPEFFITFAVVLIPTDCML